MPLVSTTKSSGRKVSVSHGSSCQSGVMEKSQEALSVLQLSRIFCNTGALSLTECGRSVRLAL